jgi:hypothetical protein
MAKDEGKVEAAARSQLEAREMSTPGLVGEAAHEAVALVRAEVQLLKAELKQDVAEDIKAARGLTGATVCALALLHLLLVAGAAALALVMPLWGALLLVAGVVALAGGILGGVGWKHVKTPLERTRRTLKEDLRWMKERTA